VSIREMDPERIAWLRALTLGEVVDFLRGHYPTEPAPPDEMPLELPEEAAEQKPPGSCCVGGCQAPAGFHFAPQYCQTCGLAEFGVRDRA